MEVLITVRERFVHRNILITRRSAVLQPFVVRIRQKKFIMAVAPARELSKGEREKPFESFPEVGTAAPDFSIADVQGRKFSLTQLKDKKALVLVFSRAHW